MPYSCLYMVSMVIGWRIKVILFKEIDNLPDERKKWLYLFVFLKGKEEKQIKTEDCHCKTWFGML